jgi:uracil phosphoribosyltransferase
MPVEVAKHPLAQHLLALLRNEETEPDQFRQYSKRLTTILTLEATRDLSVQPIPVRTPIELIEGAHLASPIAVVPILRAGLGMLEPIVDLLPHVSVGYIGLERDETTAVANSYYKKLPKLDGKVVLLCDPMLATGGSAAKAVSALVDAGAERVKMICVVAAPEGLECVLTRWPDVQVYTASIDDGLTTRKYIRPGLGDYGDRLYGTF